MPTASGFANSEMGHLWLVGMMGVGKTTVGRRVAERLDLPFVDVDAVVAAIRGTTVATIFADEGEQAFRVQERIAISSAASGPRAVIAAGGGAVLDQDNVAAMKSSGEVVLLEAPADVLVARLETNDGGRPLLDTGNVPERIAQLLAARRDAYRAAADRIVDTADRHPSDVAEEVAGS